MRPKTLGRIEAEKYCKDFPNHGDLTIAKKLYKDFPLYFNDVEDARSKVRGVRGHMGIEGRGRLVDKSLVKPITNNKDAWADMPESYSEDYTAFRIDQSKVLILSDIHIPYHSVEALKLALEYGIKKEVNCILINGDLMDFHYQSRFEKDPNARSTKQEFDATRSFLRLLRDKFPNTKIVFKEGNHDERWEKWLYVKAPEIFGDPEFTLEGRLKLGELGIEIVKHKLPITIGKLNVLHGHELQGSGGVNPARATFLKTIENVLIGHCHRSSEHTEPTFGGRVIVTTSQGCLCGLYPMFARVNKWNLGFSYVEHDLKSGDYHLHNKKIIEGKIF